MDFDTCLKFISRWTVLFQAERGSSQVRSKVEIMSVTKERLWNHGLEERAVGILRDRLVALMLPVGELLQ